jgi:hypothetical membrane protein
VEGKSVARRRLFSWVMICCVQFVVLTLVAMFVYPGGTVADPAARGYAFFRNFFSDLGRTRVPLGTPNTVSALLFFFALALAGLGLVLFFVAMPGFFRHSRPARVLSGAGSILGMVAGLSFVGVACTPANLSPGPHRFFVQVAFLSFFAAVLFYTPTILLTPAYPRRYALVLAAFALLLAGYLWLLFFGPNPTSPQGLVVQAAGQKIIAYATILTALIQAGGARRLA